jgi:hypothetical protein
MGDEFSAAGDQNREPKEARKTQILVPSWLSGEEHKTRAKTQAILDLATPNQKGKKINSKHKL